MTILFHPRLNTVNPLLMLLPSYVIRYFVVLLLGIEYFQYFFLKTILYYIQIGHRRGALIYIMYY